MPEPIGSQTQFAEDGSTMRDFPPGFEWSDEEQRPTVVRYSAQETAEILRVTERTVRRWIEAGRLEAVKEGGIYRINLDEARAVLADSRPGSSSHRQFLADRVEWLEAENARLWALLEKVVTHA